MRTVQTTLRQGYQVASGLSQENPALSQGTIRMQLPFFKEQGLDIDAYFEGNFRYATLNLSIAPCRFTIGQTSYYLEQVKWTDLSPPENFFFSPAQLRFKGRTYKALLYIPDPKTKPDCHQGADILEVIANEIPDVTYGDKIDLLYTPEEILIVAPDAIPKKQNDERTI
ncbi:MAG: hypothetical protein AB7E52_01795 [Bdellovibrionales bacterium]